ncbi:MAG: hypothetical protein N4A59_08025 [Marinifilum sp.]|jgi:hypothetical protein|nr:hypothetical protein [Marinifilum sp.]
MIQLLFKLLYKLLDETPVFLRDWNVRGNTVTISVALRNSKGNFYEDFFCELSGDDAQANIKRVIEEIDEEFIQAFVKKDS